MRLFHSYHKNRFSDLVHSEFWIFEFSVWLHVFSRALIAVFIPILFLKTGYDIGDVVLFYFLFNLFDVPLNFLARKLIQDIGARWTIILGSLASLGFFVCLYFLTGGNWPLLFAMALWSAVYDSFYWVAHLYIFMEASKHDKDVTKDTSILYVVRQVAGIAAPIIGAVILIFFDQKILTVLSVFILCLSIIPLFKIKHIHDRPTEGQKRFSQFFKAKEDVRDYISLAFYSLHCSVEDIMWPLFIFAVLGTVESVAFLPIIVSVTTIIFIYLAGHITKQKRRKIIALSGLLIALVWISRMMIDATMFYYISAFLIGMLSLMISIPLESNVFERGGHSDSLTASTYKNVVSMLVRALLFGVLALLINVYDISFVAASMSMFLLMVFNFAFRGSINMRDREIVAIK